MHNESVQFVKSNWINMTQREKYDARVVGRGNEMSIRRRPEADNTMRTPAPQNISWNRMKREPCIFCGLYHDGAGRTLDEKGKLFKPSEGYIKCPVEIEQATKVNNRYQPRPKVRPVKRDQNGKEMDR